MWTQRSLHTLTVITCTYYTATADTSYYLRVMKSILFIFDYYWLIRRHSVYISIWLICSKMYLLMFSVKCIPYHHVVGLLFIRKRVSLFCFVFFVSVYRDYNRAKTTWPRVTWPENNSKWVLMLLSHCWVSECATMCSHAHHENFVR